MVASSMSRPQTCHSSALKWMVHQKIAPLHHGIDPLSQIGWDPVSLQQIEKPSSSAFLIGHEEISKFSAASLVLINEAVSDHDAESLLQRRGSRYASSSAWNAASPTCARGSAVGAARAGGSAARGATHDLWHDSHAGERCSTWVSDRGQAAQHHNQRPSLPQHRKDPAMMRYHVLVEVAIVYDYPQRSSAM
jgi:hypothetical protein